MTDLFPAPALAVLLAVLAAAGFAGAAVLQHRAVAVESGPAGADPGRSLSLRGLRAVARRPGWLAGLALAGGGTALHAVALVLAPLSVVQPVGVLAVPIAVLMTAVGTGRPPARGVLAGVAISVVGVAAFVGTAVDTAVGTPAAGGTTLRAGLVVAGLVLVLAGVGLAGPGRVRCVARATAGAAAFGLVSALVRAVSQSVAGGGTALVDPAVPAAVAGIGAAVLVGGWLVQQAFACGPPEVVVGCLTVVDPIVAVGLGVVLLGEGAATPPGSRLLLLTAAVVAAGGVLALARHHPDAAARTAAARPSTSAAASQPEPSLRRR
jgi:hypothetical protein